MRTWGAAGRRAAHCCSEFHEALIELSCAARGKQQLRQPAQADLRHLPGGVLVDRKQAAQYTVDIAIQYAVQYHHIGPNGDGEDGTGSGCSRRFQVGPAAAYDSEADTPPMFLDDK